MLPTPSIKVPWYEKIPTLQKYGLLFLFYAVTHLLVIAGYHYRGVDWSTMDAGNYLASAQYIEQHGQLSLADDQTYRQFAGLPLLLVLVDQVVHRMPLAGYLVVTVSGLASILLTQHLFRNWKLTALSSVFLPYVLATSCDIWSDPSTLCCFLLAVYAMTRLKASQGLFWLCLLLAGYGLVLRQTAAFLILPYLFISALRTESLGGRGAGVVLLVALLPLTAYLLWMWSTLHQFFPQVRLQLEYLNAYVDRMPDPGRYSRQLIDIPLRSYFASITDPAVNFWKKLMVTAVLEMGIWALILLLQQSKITTDPARKTLLLAFAGALGLHMLFHVAIGGTFGFNALDRYFAQANPIITYALFQRSSLTWKWVSLLTILSVMYAANIGEGIHSLCPFK